MSREMAAEGALGGGSLADLYVAHAPDGIRLAFLLTGDRALAEDLVQDAFARLVGRLRRLRDPSAFDAYLRRTIVNLATSHCRRRRVERVYVERCTRPCSGCPSDQRAAIVLRFYEDLSDSQTAAILRCATGTVRSLVSRGMTTLRQELEGMPR